MGRGIIGRIRLICLNTVSPFSRLPVSYSQHRGCEKSDLFIADDVGDRFFKYNDELVTEVPATEVLEDRTGSDANPALLCYVRKGQDLVHTLHRRILEDAGETGQGEVEAVPPIEGEQAPRDEPVEGTKDDVVMESQGYNSNAQSLNYL